MRVTRPWLNGMPPANAYLTREELLREVMSADDSAAPNVVDDAVIDEIIEDASRAVDHYCARQFWAASETLRLDAPPDRFLWFGKDVLSVQSVTNGDGASVASADYYLWPEGAQSYAALVLNENAAGWVAASTGNRERAISVAASTGYCDRAASAASAPGASQRVIRNTRRAALIKAMILYRQRYPSSVETRVLKDSDWQALVQGYIRHAY